MAFIKKHPYIIINVCGLLLVLLCFLSESAAYFGESVLFLAAMIFTLKFLPLIFTTIFLLTINVVAFYQTESGSTENGVALSVFGGSLGAFAAVHTVNKKHEKAKVINLIFCIQMWILIYLAVSHLLYYYDYYHWSWFNINEI